MTGNDSMTDVAYGIMKTLKKPISFYDLWEKVVEKIQLTSEEEANDLISYFYTNLTIDGRFVNVGDNKWELRERVPYDKVHIDMNEIYQEDEEESEFDADDENEVDDMYISDDEEEEKTQKFDEFSGLIPEEEEEE